MGIRNIDAAVIRDTVKNLCIESNCVLNDDILNALNKGMQTETKRYAKDVFKMLLINQDIAKERMMPICQDTGTTVIFIEIGQDAHVTGGSLKDAINEGVNKAYTEGCLRMSIVSDPVLDRTNTMNNTPAIIHIDIIEGDKLSIEVCPKGAGSENMSALAMLKPADGLEGVKDFIIDTVKRAGANPCPPIIVGVGIGGNFEYAPYLAKKALNRSIDIRHPIYADLETELLNKINELDIGAQGLGGRTTALAVNIETYPTHIASLPVAVNIGCHVTRHKKVIL